MQDVKKNKTLIWENPKQENGEPLITLAVPTLQEGGIPRTVLNLSNNLVNNGFAVDILVIGNANGPYNKTLDKRIKVIALEARHPWSAGIPFLFFLSSWIEIFSDLRKYLDKRDPAILILNRVALPIAVLLFFFNCKFNTIDVVHSVFSKYVVDEYGRFKYQLVKFFYRCFYKKVDKVVGVSIGVIENLKSLRLISAEKSCCIYNPVVNWKLIKHSKQITEHPWFFPKANPVCISVGRLSSEKGFEILLLAFAIVHRSFPNVKLIIYGDGPDRTRLESLCSRLNLSEFVALPGRTSEPFAYMAAADVFVLPSLYEGLPTVLIEALASGTTCVATDCPSGPKEILEDGKYGYLVPVNNAKALAEGIITALKKPIPKELLRKRADLFSEERATKNYIGLIDEILQ